VLNALREWKLVCPKRYTGKKDANGDPIGVLDLVFPTGNGKVESLSNIMQRGFDPIQVEAGVSETKPELDNAGKPVLDDAGMPMTVTVGKYGMHALRHACASLWIENGMNPKRIQKLMGHASIQMTYDVYGHWFTDDAADQQAAEDIQARLLGK